MVTVLAFAAASYGVVMAVSPVLQIRRMRERRSSADVSIGYLAILLPGFALWIGYGFTTRDVPLVVPNCVAFAVGATAVGYALRLRRGTDVRNS
jgi:MtN3 and saliva related transmembrane protein